MSDAFRDESALRERLQRAEEELKELREDNAKLRSDLSKKSKTKVWIAAMVALTTVFGGFVVWTKIAWDRRIDQLWEETLETRHQLEACRRR